MLIGEYAHNLDAKGRVNFPSKLREDLGESFIVTKGLDNCLFVYSISEWKILEDKIRSLPMSKSRNLQRFMFAGAIEVQTDKQGRIIIPSNLREYAGLTKEIMIVGASVRAEIWDKESYDKINETLTADMIAQAMDDLDF
ncbi:MAG: division/cell wall cluster transcriptional repressor MraZ [Bacilli bacterium]